jgi:DNA helicase-2/ATP-dependent DNA helicase PcrA
VLVRARSDVPDLYAAMLAENLPVEVVGLGGLLALPEIVDVVAVLEVLDDPTANAALVRLLAGPRFRLGVRDLAALGRRARDALREDGTRPDTLEGADPAAADALTEAVADVDPCDVIALSDVLHDPGPQLSDEARARVVELGRELAGLRAHVGDGLLDLIHRVVATIGLDVELAASPRAVTARRRENLAAFLDVAAGFADPDGPGSLTSFLAFLRAAREYERGLEVTGPTGVDAIALMTMHRSKGLEWDVVAVPNLTRDVFPDLKIRGRWTTSAAVLPTPLRGDAAELPAFTLSDQKKELDAFAADCKEYLEREERRLAYVAFTRARSILLGSGHWWGPTQKGARGASVFLTELYEHARAGDGEVDVWAPEPVEETNPALATAAEYAWPAPYEAAAFALRDAAAEAVRGHLDVLAAGATPPVDDLVAMHPRERALLTELDREATLLLAEARAAASRWRDVELPRSLTASQIVRLGADRDGLARELARPLPQRPVPQARRGTRFHVWVEEIFEHRPLIDREDLPGAADADVVDDADLVALQRAFLAGAYGGRRPFAVEAPFELPLAGRVVRGRIDAVYDLGGGRWQVVDWKTGAGVADAVQLAVYRIAWARLRGVDPDDVDAVFLYVRTGEVARPPLLSEAELVTLLAEPP